MNVYELTMCSLPPNLRPYPLTVCRLLYENPIFMTWPGNYNMLYKAYMY